VAAILAETGSSHPLLAATFRARQPSKPVMLATFWHEVRFALRGLKKDKSFAVTALLSIGLGVGANAAIFSLVNQALLRPLPVSEPERLVLLNWRGTFIGKGWGSSNLMSYPFYQDLRDQTDVFEGVFGRAPTTVNLGVDGAAETVGAEIVTGSYFHVLGVSAFMGHTIEEADDRQPGAHPVVVLSYDYWRNHLGSRADIVGHTVSINTYPMTVIGIAAPEFRGIDWGEVPSLWLPTMMKRQATPDFDWLFDRRGVWLHVFGRLKPGDTAQRVQTALQPWFAAMLATDTRREDWPHVTAERQRRYLAASLELLPAGSGRSDWRGRLERPLLVLLAATTLVLLLACLNVANLYLARGFAHRRETALRLALGASRGRVVRELLVQSAILALAGAAVGLMLAPVFVRTLVAFLPRDVSSVDLRAGIDPFVFVVALAAALVTAVLFSLAPAFRTARAEPSRTLKEESAAIGGGIALRKTLVIGQIALALILLVGAGLFVRTLGSLRAKGPGFPTTNLALLAIDTSRSGYSQLQSATLARSLLEKLRALPEVDSVGLSAAELLAGGSWNQGLTVDAGRRFVTEAGVHCNAISPGFFDALGVPLTRGRDFTDRDALLPTEAGRPDDGKPSTFRSAIINESFAHRYFGDRNPIGARLGLGREVDSPDIEIVGVVKTFTYRGLRETDDQAFFPLFESSIAGGRYWIRTRVASESAFAAIRSAVRALDPLLPVVRLRTLDDQLDRSLWNERLLATLAAAFAGLATLLAVVGVYGLMSFVVSQRTREIGIRVALGASRGSAVWLILREVLTMLAWGILIALPGLWSLGRFVESQLFGVHATDWRTALGASVLVALVALVASALPLRRATAINPIDALRCE
jgi:putative ABC transport system permease protein